VTRTIAIACAVLASLSGCTNSGAPTHSQAQKFVVRHSVLRTIGLPVYPGSAPTEGGSAVAARRGRTVIAAYYKTPDSLDRVVKFYAARMPKRSLQMYLHTNGQGVADFAVTHAGVTKQVTLSQSDADTIIALSAAKGR